LDKSGTLDTCLQTLLKAVLKRFDSLKVESKNGLERFANAVQASI
jgi:hypothetical protein